MILIKHGSEPNELRAAKRELRRTPDTAYNYDSLPSQINGYASSPKMAVLSQLLDEQGFLCAYCMRRIKETQENNEAHIEHWIPRSIGTGEDSLEFSNMLAVCEGGGKGVRKKDQTCDRKRGNRALTIDPRKELHIRSLTYDDEGKILSSDKVLQSDIDDVLNLNKDDLKLQRKIVIQKTKAHIVNCYRGCGTNSKKGQHRVEESFEKVKSKNPRFQHFGAICWCFENHLRKRS